MSEVLAIIPARSGSKSVKNKNIRVVNGKPLMAYSIEHALRSSRINRVIVSTDDPGYAEIALANGAETPFLRPKEYAQDSSLDIDVFRHALRYLEENEGYVPDVVVQLRPTYPIRDVADIDRMVEIMENDPSIDSVRCIAPAKEIAYKMWKQDDKGFISPILTDIAEAYNMPRQQLPQIYYQNACIDVIRTKVITEGDSMSGKKIMGYKMSHNFDIDTEEELKKAEEFLKLTEGNHTFVFDIDGVVAQFNETLQYDKSLPNHKMINIINYLYDHGNEIILFTARGYKTGMDWEKITQEQMKAWGVKYHELKMGKPNIRCTQSLLRRILLIYM